MTSQVITSTQHQAPYLEDATQRLLSSVQGTEGVPGLLDRPYENYNELADQGLVDPRLAGFSPDQVQAFDLARSGVGGYQPYMDAAVDTVNTAPQAGANLLGESAQYDTDLSQYLNPYTQAVIDPTMTEMVRQQQIEQDRLDAKTAQAGSFGGSRHALAEAEMSRGHDFNRGRMASELNQKGYDAAQRAQEQHRVRQANAGLGIGQLGLDTARVQSGLGQLNQELNAADVTMMGTVGGIQQQQLQKEYDINYNQWLEEYQDPYGRAAFESDIIRGVPSSQSTMTAGVVPEKSTLSQGIGALGQFASTGNQFGWWGDGSGDNA